MANKLTKKIKSSLSQIEVNDSFQKALDLILKESKNVFVTGKAGTGKSTLLNLIQQQSKKNLVVLAPTGLAALNIGGQTIHSFFRFSPQINIKKAIEIGLEKQTSKVLQKLDILIIDEISMVRSDLLDCVDACLKASKRNLSPFGGVQIVFIGDLYQLPPVIRNSEIEDFQKMYSSPYFFSAKVIQELFAGDMFDSRENLELVELEKIYRQSDSEFIEILNTIRRGEKNPEILKKLNSRVMESVSTNKAIILTTTNQLAEEINQTNLSILLTKPKTYRGIIAGSFKQSDLPTSEKLELKSGARVMFVKNDLKGKWVNGSLGYISGVFPERVVVILDEGKTVEVYPEIWEIYQTAFNSQGNSLENEIIGSFTQLPLKLAWAITIHKSQGQTFDEVVLDLKHRAFSAGQTYVALSRCRTLDGLYLTKPVEPSDIRTDYSVSKFLTEWQYKLAEQKQPKNEKQELILKAIRNQTKLEIVYLKGKNEKSKRVILPKEMGMAAYHGKEFIAINAFCFTRNENRVFAFDRVLEVKEDK